MPIDQPRSSHRHAQWDACFVGNGSTFVEVKRTHSMRDIREVLLSMAYRLSDGQPGQQAVLVLVGSKLSASRLHEELAKFRAVVLPKISERVHVVLAGVDGKIDERQALTPLLRDELFVREVQDCLRQAGGGISPAPSFSAKQAVISTIVHLSVTRDGPITASQIQTVSGTSQPTTANVITTMKDLGLLEQRDRSWGIRLKPLNPEQWLSLAREHIRTRKVFYFADPLKLTMVKAIFKRIHLLNSKGTLSGEQLRVGGVLGADAHYPLLDITAPRRVDVSTVMAADAIANMIDAGLQPIDESHAEFAILAVHVTRDPGSYTGNADGIPYASHFECLADLIELGYLNEAQEFAMHMSSVLECYQ